MRNVFVSVATLVVCAFTLPIILPLAIVWRTHTWAIRQLQHLWYL